MDDLRIQKGLIVASQANFFRVKLDKIQDDKNQIPINLNNPCDLLCTIRKRLVHQGDSVYVGDKVWVEEIDWLHNRAVIFDIEPRKNLLPRPPVANVTDIVVALSFNEPVFEIDQATRFLLSAENSGPNVLLLLTKSDLIDQQSLSNQIERLKSWGYNPLSISTKTGQGLLTLKNHLKSNQLTVICGPSGVGKSSLINMLLPNLSIPIGGLSRRLQRGRHTTRHVELFSLDIDSFVADTPGFNIIENDIKSYQLSLLFPELRNQLNSYPCRFRDCLHLDEPGCGVDKSWERYFLYKRFINERF